MPTSSAFKDLYRRAGEAAATVTYRIVNLPNGRVDVVFNIDEGAEDRR